MMFCIATVYSVGVLLYVAADGISIRCIKTEIKMLSGCDGIAEWKRMAETRREDHIMAHARLMSSRRLTADPWAGMSLGHRRARHSEGVRGIERGIELPVMPLANGTGDEVICHRSLLQSGPRKWGDRVEPGKDITR
jgi:hypothetical protein